MFTLGEVPTGLLKLSPTLAKKATGSDLASYAAQTGLVLAKIAAPATLLTAPAIKILFSALKPPDPYKGCFDACSGQMIGKVLRSTGKECWEVLPNTLNYDFVGNSKGEYFSRNKIIEGYNSGYLFKCAVDRYNSGKALNKIKASELKQNIDTPSSNFTVSAATSETKKKMM